MKFVTLFVLLLSGALVHSFALTTNWTNASGGNWSVSSNWDNGVPTASDTANITLNGTYTVTVDSVSSLEVLILGGATGSQTLFVSHSLGQYANPSPTSCQIGVNGILDIDYAAIFLGGPGSVTSTNSGTILLHGEGGIYLNDATLRNDVSGLLHLYDCGAHLRWDPGGGALQNYGTLEVEGSCGADIRTPIYNYSTGIFTVNCPQNMNCGDVTNYGFMEVQYGTALHLPGGQNGPGSPGFLLNYGTCIIRGGVLIDGQFFQYSDVPPIVYNYETMEVAADSSLSDENVILSGYFENRGVVNGETANLRLTTGNLDVTDPSGSPLSFSDSVHVAAGCTLSVSGALFDSSTIVDGSGTVHFEGEGNEAKGHWNFTGGFMLSNAGDPEPSTRVTFAPTPPPLTVHLSSLNISTPRTSFYLTVGDTISVDSLQQSGGLFTGAIVVENTYVWGSGILSADSADQITIPAGTSVTVSGSGNRTLDSLHLNIEGSVVMQDSGLITFENSAVMNITPGGTLDVNFGVTLTGVGTLYNSGETSFDALLDSILIDVPVINSTFARTPGTIEILSGTVVFGQGGNNDGTVNLQVGSQWIVSGDYNNSGTITIATGATLRVLGSFVNDVTGIISGNGILDISNAISFINNGTISPGASPGLLSVNGDLALGSTSHLLLELAGASPSFYDRLAVTGLLSLDGSVEFVLQNGYSPAPQDTLSLLTFTSFTGMFTAYIGTELSNGQSLDLGFGPNGLSGYRCVGDPGISTDTTPIEYLLHSTQDSAWVYSFPVSNPGACALDYSAVLLSVNPPSPAWITITDGSSAHLFHNQTDTIELLVNVFGRPDGSYSASLHITSNVPGSESLFDPINFDVIDSLDKIQHLVIIRDGASANIRLIWEPIFGAQSYLVYGDSIAGFAPNSSRLLGTAPSNNYTHINGTSHSKFFYLVTSSTLPPASASTADLPDPVQITNPDPYFGLSNTLWR